MFISCFKTLLNSTNTNIFIMLSLIMIKYFKTHSTCVYISNIKHICIVSIFSSMVQTLYTTLYWSWKFRNAWMIRVENIYVACKLRNTCKNTCKVHTYVHVYSNVLYDCFNFLLFRVSFKPQHSFGNAISFSSCRLMLKE